MFRKFKIAALVFAVAIANLLAVQESQADSLSRCLEFSGKNYAEASSKIVPVSGNFTVELWVYPKEENAGNFAEFISQGVQPFAFYIGIDPKGYLRLGDSWMSTGVKIKSETWTHIAFTHDTSDLGRLFINGVLISAHRSEKAFNSSGTNTRFGAQYGVTPYEFFKGCLDEVRIWNSIRTNEEISFNKDRFGISTQTPNLIASYSFDILTGYKNAQKILTPDESKSYPNSSPQLKALTFNAFGGNLALYPRGEFVPTSGIDNCEPQNGKFEFVNLKSVPKVLRFNGRSDRQASIDVTVTGIPVGACVGFDTFVSGTTEPLTSTVALLSTGSASAASNRFKMNIDTSPFGCSSGRSQVDIRGWWSDGEKSSQYGVPYRLPNCSGNIPTSETSLLTNLTSVSLVGENSRPSKWRGQTQARLKHGSLKPAETRVNNLVGEPIQDLEGCHSLLKVGILQKIQDGLWVDVKSFDRWVQSAACSGPTPYQPVVTISLPDTTVLRWKVSDGATWEFVSSPFIRRTGADGTAPSIDSQVAEVNSIKVLESPTGISVSLIGKEVVIKVFLPPTSRSKVEEVNLVSASLGYPAAKPLVGEIKGASGVFRIPTSKLADKSGKHTLKIDSRGTGVTTSRELIEVVDLSKFAETPKVIKPKPTLKPAKVTCFKGALIRTFDGNACPPGYRIKN